jgi:hypothetical protein
VAFGIRDYENQIVLYSRLTEANFAVFAIVRNIFDRFFDRLGRALSV